MKCTNVFVAALFALGAGSVAAEQVPAGTFQQTSSTAGDCADCAITITKVTPHIVQIASSNGWVGYAHYDANADQYTGAFEWKAGEGGDFDNVVVQLDMSYEGQTLTFDARSDPLSFSSTFRRK